MPKTTTEKSSNYVEGSKAWRRAAQLQKKRDRMTSLISAIRDRLPWTWKGDPASDLNLEQKTKLKDELAAEFNMTRNNLNTTIARRKTQIKNYGLPKEEGLGYNLVEHKEFNDEQAHDYVEEEVPELLDNAQDDSISSRSFEARQNTIEAQKKRQDNMTLVCAIKERLPWVWKDVPESELNQEQKTKLKDELAAEFNMTRNNLNTRIALWKTQIKNHKLPEEEESESNNEIEYHEVEEEAPELPDNAQDNSKSPKSSEVASEVNQVKQNPIKAQKKRIDKMTLICAIKERLPWAWQDNCPSHLSRNQRVKKKDEFAAEFNMSRGALNNKILRLKYEAKTRKHRLLEGESGLESITEQLRGEEDAAKLVGNAQDFDRTDVGRKVWRSAIMAQKKRNDQMTLISAIKDRLPWAWDDYNQSQLSREQKAKLKAELAAEFKMSRGALNNKILRLKTQYKNANHPPGETGSGYVDHKDLNNKMEYHDVEEEVPELSDNAQDDSSLDSLIMEVSEDEDVEQEYIYKSRASWTELRAYYEGSAPELVLGSGQDEDCPRGQVMDGN